MCTKISVRSEPSPIDGSLRHEEAEEELDEGMEDLEEDVVGEVSGVLKELLRLIVSPELNVEVGNGWTNTLSLHCVPLQQ